MKRHPMPFNRQWCQNLFMMACKMIGNRQIMSNEISALRILHLVVPHGTLVCQLFCNSDMVFAPIPRTGALMIPFLGLDIAKYFFKVASFNFAKYFVRVHSLGAVSKLHFKSSVEICPLSPFRNLDWKEFDNYRERIVGNYNEEWPEGGINP